MYLLDKRQFVLPRLWPGQGSCGCSAICTFYPSQREDVCPLTAEKATLPYDLSPSCACGGMIAEQAMKSLALLRFAVIEYSSSLGTTTEPRRLSMLMMNELGF